MHIHLYYWWQTTGKEGTESHNWKLTLQCPSVTRECTWCRMPLQGRMHSSSSWPPAKRSLWRSSLKNRDKLWIDSELDYGMENGRGKKENQKVENSSHHRRQYTSDSHSNWPVPVRTWDWRRTSKPYHKSTLELSFSVLLGQEWLPREPEECIHAVDDSDHNRLVFRFLKPFSFL